MIKNYRYQKDRSVLSILCLIRHFKIYKNAIFDLIDLLLCHIRHFYFIKMSDSTYLILYYVLFGIFSFVLCHIRHFKNFCTRNRIRSPDKGQILLNTGLGS